ncbi:unnamed protein product [Porites lobata]|uniref:OTU domain-containing protein n=1 Tax=Porites lobata TaxID=104759 RepID=A0ABN8P1Q5_9CNID|nr:unnamed protein product [Porites lobata]
MTNWKTEFHKPLTRPGVKHDEEMSICSSTPQAHRGYINSSLLESDLKMSESHANVVSFDENVSTLSNLYERNEHLLMNETTVENMTTIGTVYESMMRNQRTYLANQDNKHRLEDECTDFSLNTSRNGVGEVSKRSRSKSKFSCKYGGARRDREASRLQCKKIIKISRPVGRNTCSAYSCVTHHIYLVKTRTSKHKNMDVLLCVNDSCGLNNCYSIKCNKQQEKYCFSRANIFTSGDIELNPGPANAYMLLQSRLAQQGLSTLDVGGAGDCFFRAVSHQLYGEPSYHMNIRCAT